MSWPTLPEYNAALSRAPQSFVPESLSGFRVVNGPLGLPMPVSGGYAYIYELRSEGGGRKALRCFREDDPVRRARAARVCRDLSAALQSSPALRPHFLNASWEEPCIRTGKGDIPAMVMDWADARTLGAFLEAAQDDPSALLAARERIAELLALLASEGIVHGDLQTGNILIRSDGTPVLIDYDGMRFPSSPEEPAAPDAHPHFQHPEWDEDCNPALKDRFPSLAIDLGLAALAARPGLFARFSTGENVLLRAEDYAEPEASPVFQAVREIPTLARAADLLAGLALAPLSALPTLSEFRSEAYRSRPRTEKAQATGSVSTPAPAAPAYRSLYEVFPASDYSGIMNVVGQKVEVVGRVVEVKSDHTRYGKPYAFVNFGNWRRDGFKLTVWSEGLETFRKPPTESWEGRWVSATGLVDEPYESKRFGNTQLSITIQDASQVRFLDEAEALRRLGKTDSRTGSGAARTSAGLGAGNTGAGQASRPTSKPSNEDILKGLGGAASRARPAAAKTSGSASFPGHQSGTPSPAPRPSPPAKEPNGCLGYALIGIGVLIYMFIRNKF